jgi:hypothetical protein
MALLLALLTYQAGDTDPMDYAPQYDLWTRQQNAANPPMPERKGLALAGLYDMLYYSGTPDTELGLVLATLMGNKPIATPASDNNVILLRRELRKGTIDAFKTLRGTYNP